MGILKFLLDTTLGHIVIGLVFAGLFGAGMYWRGHNKGWDSATAHYAAVVQACMIANERNLETIRELQHANQTWVDASKADAATIARAVKAAEAASKTNTKALAVAQARVHELERQHGDVRAWADARIPDPLYRELCQHADCAD